MANLENEAVEVVLHGAQEVSERGLNLLHLLLDAHDSFLELLANVGRTRVVLALGDEHLLGLDVAHFFGLQLNVVVGRPLVDDLDVAEFVAHDLVLDGALVAMARLILDLSVDEGVLGEDLVHEELLGQGERLDLCLGDVHELGLRVAAQIVVAEERV